MRKLTFTAFALLSLGLGACNESLDRTGSHPNPLMLLDEDRRWIILHAGYNFPKYCGQYYDAPKDPRYEENKTTCEKWELNTVDYLKENKLDPIEIEHLREVKLWEWRNDFSAKISACHKKYKGAKTRKESRENSLKSAECDPFDVAQKDGAKAHGLTKIRGSFTDAFKKMSN